MKQPLFFDKKIILFSEPHFYKRQPALVSLQNEQEPDIENIGASKFTLT